MIRKSKSLTFRIILLSGAWILLALAGTAFVLLDFYQDHIEDHYDAHVLMHMEEMVSSARLTPEGEIDLAYPPSDPRFQINHSGWYWEIRHNGRVIASSPSLAGATLALGSLQNAEHEGAHIIDGPDHNPVRVQTMLVPAGIASEQLLLAASAPMFGIIDDVKNVASHLVVSFFVLALGLLLAVLLQVRVALRPIHDIGQRIVDVHVGKVDTVEGQFPRDVQPLVTELNNLLVHNAVLLRRARNQVGDLAHSIKNPLTVINNEARQMDSGRGQLILKQTLDIENSVNHHLSRARAFGTTNVLGSRAKVKPVAEDLAYALQRIYKHRDLEFDLSGLCDQIVRCEVQDLEEMLGNLMDNAAKWAKRSVFVHCACSDGRCALSVEDDGPGIPADRIEQVLQRGERLDETREGHGLGLSIVRDLVELYRGNLSLGRSDHGGLSAMMDLPSGRPSPSSAG